MRTRKTQRTATRVRPRPQRPPRRKDSGSRSIALLVALIASVCFLNYAYSAAPKGPLEEILPGNPAETQTRASTTVDQFLVERAALEGRVAREQQASTPRGQRGDPHNG